VEHPITLPAGRNWRATALVAASVAALELIVVVVLALAAFGLPFDEQRRALLRTASGESAVETAKPAPTAKQGKPGGPASKLPRSETSVVVLNGNGISGAADLTSGKVRRLQYVLTGTANAPRSDFARTMVMYRPGFEGEAHRLARDVRASRVVPLDGMRASDLMGAQIALILGRK
jgi:hypothetical protein